MYGPRVVALVALFGSVNAQVGGYGQFKLIYRLLAMHK